MCDSLDSGFQILSDDELVHSGREETDDSEDDNIATEPNVGPTAIKKKLQRLTKCRGSAHVSLWVYGYNPSTHIDLNVMRFMLFQRKFGAKRTVACDLSLIPPTSDSTTCIYINIR